MTTWLRVRENHDSLPVDGRLIMRSGSEKLDGVAFVSGIQGVICTTYMDVEYHPTTGESRLRPVCGSVGIATPMDIFTIKETTPNWRVS